MVRRDKRERSRWAKVEGYKGKGVRGNVLQSLRTLLIYKRMTYHNLLLGRSPDMLRKIIEIDKLKKRISLYKFILIDPTEHACWKFTYTQGLNTITF